MTGPDLSKTGPADDGADPGFSEALINEVAATLPADAPQLYRMHQVSQNRRLRAKLAEAVRDMQPLLDWLSLQEDGKHDVADELRLMADIEDFLGQFAVDQAAYKAWVERPDVSDADLVALLATFGKGLRAGEASSSLT